MTTANDDTEVVARALQHYRLVGPLIEASFAGTPIVFAHYPKGLDQPADYHVTAVQLSFDKLLWLVHREYAIEFFTWAPLLLDLGALRFGRILLLANAWSRVRTRQARGSRAASTAFRRREARGDSVSRRRNGNGALDSLRRRVAGGCFASMAAPVV